MEAHELIRALVAAGMTQSQIADRTGVPQPTISKVMRGEVKDVMSRNYLRIQALHAEVVLGTAPAANTALQEASDAA